MTLVKIDVVQRMIALYFTHYEENHEPLLKYLTQIERTQMEPQMEPHAKGTTLKSCKYIYLMQIYI